MFWLNPWLAHNLFNPFKLFYVYYAVRYVSFSHSPLLPSHLLCLSLSSSTCWFMSVSSVHLQVAPTSLFYLLLFPESSLFLSVSHPLFPASAHWLQAFLLIGEAPMYCTREHLSTYTERLRLVSHPWKASSSCLHSANAHKCLQSTKLILQTKEQGNEGVQLPHSCRSLSNPYRFLLYEY